jgi:hypothetical protein
MSKRLLGLVIIVAALILLPASASAHVLIKDEIKGTGAILHINPDDDPVAGERAGLFFDIRDTAVAEPGTTVQLTITGEQSAPVQVAAELQGSSVSVSYTFPQQGLYRVQLDVRQNGETTHTFVHPQRVGRGIIGTTNAPNAPMWAEVGMIFSALAVICLGIIAWNRRKAISEYSKW